MLLIAALTGAFGALAWTARENPPAHLSTAAKSAPPVRVAAVAPTPIRIVIPAIGVSADIEPLQRDAASGALQSPVDWNHAGWYAAGVKPGEQGPAVIVGHVDSAREGPAVFYRLRNLDHGDRVDVDISDGQTREFVVDTVDEVPKSGFPTARVYGPTALPELRLITCAGQFDTAAHSYLDNLIVTAYAA